jgi:hypothetical protein
MCAEYSLFLFISFADSYITGIAKQHSMQATYHVCYGGAVITTQQPAKRNMAYAGRPAVNLLGWWCHGNHPLTLVKHATSAPQ